MGLVIIVLFVFILFIVVVGVGIFAGGGAAAAGYKGAKGSQQQAVRDELSGRHATDEERQRRTGVADATADDAGVDV